MCCSAESIDCVEKGCLFCVTLLLTKGLINLIAIITVVFDI